VRLINYPAVCPYVCLPHYKCLNQLVDFHEIQQRGMPFKVTSTPYLFIPWLQPFKNYGYSDFWGGYKSRNSQCGTIQFCMLIGLERMNNFYSVFYEKLKKKYEHGCGWKLKFMFSLMEMISELLHFDKWNLAQWKIMGIPTSFVWWCF
jgi:hypothetical protein